jgi:DNA-binding MarR family transcriptional regulator
MPATKKKMSLPQTGQTKARHRQRTPLTTSETDSAFNILINENGLLFNRLKLVAEQVHHQGEMSGGRRAILRMLEEDGAQTVPQISRARSVSRQHVQALINELAAEGYVEFSENPAHKRSPFVQLSARGQQAVKAMNRREQQLHLKLRMELSEAELLAAAQTLRTVRAVFESEQWKRLAKTIK